MKLKPLDQQVVVVVGASSGIGRESALRLADRGAAVVVAARSEAGLASLVAEITGRGGRAAMAVCDVADAEQVRRVADTAVAAFGRIDTWVSCAAVSVFARAWETTPEEYRRVMEVTYLGQVHGALAALPHLRRQGGALIGISSVEAFVTLPMHAAYSASKHAVEGFLEGLRRELRAEGVPVSVTSIKPATINTPFFTNARNTMDVKPQGPPPFYSPAVVADCVLHAAAHPVRDLFAGGAGRSMARAQVLAPKLVDAVLARVGIPATRTSEPRPGGAPGALYESSSDARSEGDFSSRQLRVSPSTWLATHPKVRAAAVGGALASAPVLISRGRSLVRAR